MTTQERWERLQLGGVLFIVLGVVGLAMVVTEDSPDALWIPLAFLLGGAVVFVGARWRR